MFVLKNSLILIIFKQTRSDRPGRVYQIGKTLKRIPQKVVDSIIKWNEGADERNDVRLDRKICHSLLLSLLSKEQLRAYDVSDDAMEFIKGNEIYIFVLIY